MLFNKQCHESWEAIEIWILYDTCVHRQTWLWGDDEQIFAGRPWESPEPAQARVGFSMTKRIKRMCLAISRKGYAGYAILIVILKVIIICSGSIVSNYLLFFEQLPYHVFLVVKTIERNTIDFGILTSLQSYCLEALVNSPYLHEIWRDEKTNEWQQEKMAHATHLKDLWLWAPPELTWNDMKRASFTSNFRCLWPFAWWGYPNGPCGTHLNTVRWGRLPHKKSRCRGSSWFESETCLFQGFQGRSNTLIYHNLPRCNLYIHWLWLLSCTRSSDNELPLSSDQSQNMIYLTNI